MALSDIELAKLEVDFCAGKISRLKIAQKHRISRNTLKKYADEKGWIYGQNEQELTNLIKNKTYQRLIDDTVDLSTQVTKNFLVDIEKYRALSLMPAKELYESYEEAKKKTEETGKRVRVPREEFDRIWQSAKAIKTSIEGLSNVYSDQRRALGLDRDDDIEKAQKIKNGSTTANNDPTEGMTREQVQEEIKKYERK